MMMPKILMGIAILVVAMMFFTTMILVVKQYGRCPSNRLLVIFGKTGPQQGARVIHGGGAFVIPLLQDYHYLSLEPMRVEVPKEYEARGGSLNLKVPAQFTVAISTDSELTQNAASRLLGLSPEEVTQLAEDAIIACLERALLEAETGSAAGDSLAFLDKLSAAIEPDLNKLGMTFVNYR